MSQSNLGIDIASRNVYVLDKEANVLSSSNQSRSGDNYRQSFGCNEWRSGAR